MAIEILIKQGDQAAENKDFLTAISKYTAALAENPQAFAPFIKRAQAHTKLCDYDSAKADISKAFTILEQRGKMADKATCYFRLGLVNYSEKHYVQALNNLRQAKKLQSSEPALDIWIEKAKRDCKKNGLDFGEEGAENEGAAERNTSLQTIAKQAPIKAKIRDEWYQSKDRVTITIYAANVQAETLQVHFSPRSLAVSFPTSESSEYNFSLDHLAGEISPEESSFSVMTKKIEITLKKCIASQWSALEGKAGPAQSAPAASTPSYPTSSQKKTDWAKFDAGDDDDNPEDFFAKLYKDVDEDTQRAMMKSYVQSNGTVLTTNWSEAKDKQFDTRPPDGMEARKW